MTIRDTELSIIARTMWQEARGEPLLGQQAVAHVIRNRVKDGRWGDTLMAVCLFRSASGVTQFSGWNHLDPNFLPACRMDDDDDTLMKLEGIFQGTANEPDPTEGATHYYAVSMKFPPTWAMTATFTKQIGQQRFYKNVK